jgi:hypothetical protein
MDKLNPLFLMKGRLVTIHGKKDVAKLLQKERVVW